MDDLLPDWLELAEYHFIERCTSVKDRIAKMCGLDEYEPLPAEQHRLFDAAGCEILCHICDGNHWIYDDGEFICDHSRDEEYELVPFPVRAEVKESAVWQSEVIR